MTEAVRVSRRGRALLLTGATTRYAIEPRGEYVFGIVEGRPMRAWRGGREHWVRPGDLVAWDASDAHRGASVDGPWRSRLMIVEADELLTGVRFPEPVIADRRLARVFASAHAELEAPGAPLAHETVLAEVLLAFVARSAGVRPAGREDRAVRVALEVLGERPERNVPLDELAAAAGVDKYRLLRAFRAQVGMPPHAWLLTRRLRLARRMLEAGAPIAETAAATGFADQSHLTRHFRRSLGFTPGAYRRHFAQ
jgi:AraC-like DNA-binding protein